MVRNRGGKIGFLSLVLGKEKSRDLKEWVSKVLLGLVGRGGGEWHMRRRREENGGEGNGFLEVFGRGRGASVASFFSLVCEEDEGTIKLTKGQALGKCHIHPLLN